MAETAKQKAEREAKEALAAQLINVYTVGIKSVQVYDAGDSNIRYRVSLDTAIPGFRKNQETEKYELVDIDYIDFVPKVLIAQCINNIDGLDLMYTKKKEQGIRNGNNAGFGAAELQIVLRGAKLDIQRTKFEAGSEYTASNGTVGVHEHEGFNTDIVKIKITEKVEAKLDSLADSILGI